MKKYLIYLPDGQMITAIGTMLFLSDFGQAIIYSNGTCQEANIVAVVPANALVLQAEILPTESE